MCRSRRRRRPATSLEALAAAGRLGYPVVLKALAGEHKSDAGGVVLGLATPDALAAAVADVARAARAAVVQRRADGARRRCWRSWSAA